MELKRSLGMWDIFCITSGAMISSGLFVLPGMAHQRAGPAVIISYLLAGLLAATGMLSAAEVATAMPRAGGDYFFISRSLGPAAGTIAGLLSWFSLALKSSFALVGIGIFVRLVLPVDTRLVGVLFCIIFTAINVAGVKHAGRTQVFMVAGMLALMLLYVIAGLRAVKVEHLSDFAPEGWPAVVATAGFVFVSFGGLAKALSLAEETRDPGRVIPRANILSLAVVVALYMGMIFVTSGVLGRERLDQSLRPMSDGAAVFLGPAGRLVLSAAAVLAFLTTANAGLLAASRYLLALGRDRLAPARCAHILRRRGTPYVAILATGAFMVASLFLQLKVLVEAASIAFIFNFLLACACVIVLREGRVQNYRPVFRSPFYPWMPLAGIVGYAWLLFSMGLEALVIGTIFVVVAFLVYWRYGHARADQEYALLHLIARVTDRQLHGRALEEELKAIIRERDNIVADRFDRLVEGCPVLDLAETMSVTDFFRAAAEALAPRLHLSTDALCAKLIDREKESPTAISASVAIPHVIIDGHQTFDILIARCTGGVVFSEPAAKVQAIFVLAGTLDERNFHLRALSAIAQIVQDPHFEEKWLRAGSTEDLRDLLLLSPRRREAPAPA